MRTLLAAAAVILSLSAAQAQEMVPVKPATTAAQETNDRAMPAQTSSSTLIDQLKAAGELKDTKTLEAPAPRLDPVQEAKPVEAKPVEARPAETITAVTPPAAATPPAVPTTTTAAKPVEAKPVEAKPVQAATEPKPAKKKIVRKRETDEQKARRIAAKYGISW